MDELSSRTKSHLKTTDVVDPKTKTAKLLRHTGTTGRKALNALASGNRRAADALLRAADDVLTHRAMLRAWGNGDIDTRELASALRRYDDLDAAERAEYRDLVRVGGKGAIKASASLESSGLRSVLDSDVSPDLKARATAKYQKIDGDYQDSFERTLRNDNVRDSWLRSAGDTNIQLSDVEIALDTVEAIERRGHKLDTFRLARSVNNQYPDSVENPYTDGTLVVEFKAADNDVFARVHGSDNQARSWMVAGDQKIRGMTTAEIQNRLALPEEPKYVSDVHVSSGTKIRAGKIAPNFGGDGGMNQFELLERIDPSNFKNKRKLPL